MEGKEISEHTPKSEYISITTGAHSHLMTLAYTRAVKFQLMEKEANSCI